MFLFFVLQCISFTVAICIMGTVHRRAFATHMGLTLFFKFLVTDKFLGISFNAFWKFLWLGIWHGIVWRLNFGPGIFLGFDFCPHSIIPVT